MSGSALNGQPSAPTAQEMTRILRCPSLSSFRAGQLSSSLGLVSVTAHTWDSSSITTNTNKIITIASSAPVRILYFTLQILSPEPSLVYLAGCDDITIIIAPTRVLSERTLM
jgi:hypothetical protein